MLSTFITVAPASAELVAYDQFADYTDGGLSGQGQGFGWGGGWSTKTNYTVSSAGNLSYELLDTAGGGASSGTSINDGWKQIQRTLAAPITNSGTYYLGFLLQPSKSGSSYARHAGIRLDADNPDDFRVGAGIWDNYGSWALRTKDGGGKGQNYTTPQTGISKTTNITHFVIKFALDTEGDERADLYVNPTNTTALANSGDASFDFSAQCPDISKVAVIRYNVNGEDGNMAFDEIRLGTEAEDMFLPLFRPPAGTVLIVK